MQEHDCGGFKLSIEEVDDGFKLFVKGDKEIIKPKLEAMEAYLNYQQKAKAAGWDIGHKHGFMTGRGHGCHGVHGHGMGLGMGHDKLKKFVGHFQNAIKEAMNEMKKD